jgi:hypothetical protein
MSLIKKTQLVIGKKTYKYSYKVSNFSGELRRYKIGNYYLVSVIKKAKMVELSNGIGGFFSYLDPNDALRIAIKGRKASIKRSTERLQKMENQLKRKSGA